MCPCESFTSVIGLKRNSPWAKPIPAQPLDFNNLWCGYSDLLLRIFILRPFCFRPASHGLGARSTACARLDSSLERSQHRSRLTNSCMNRQVGSATRTESFKGKRLYLDPRTGTCWRFTHVSVTPRANPGWLISLFGCHPK